MKNLSEKYREYKNNQKDYILMRKSLLQGPEEELGKVTDALNLSGLRSEVVVLLRKEIEDAIGLYRKIYDGRPTNEDVDKFLEMADCIMQYEDLLSTEQLKIWSGRRELVKAYGEVE